MNAVTGPDQELIEGFVGEMSGYISAIRFEISMWAETPQRKHPLIETKRAGHTIKGVAAMLGYDALSRFGYALEQLANRATQGTQKWSMDLGAALELGLDRVDCFLEGLKTGSVNDAGVIEAVAWMNPDDADPDAIVFDTPNAAATDTKRNLPLLNADDTLVDQPRMPWDADDVPAMPESTVQEFPIPEASDELLDVFRAEADDLLRVLSSQLPLAKDDPLNRDRWQDIRRAAHTLKGSAAMVGFHEVAKLAHIVEDLLDEYFEGRRTATAEEIDSLLTATDCIDDQIHHRGKNESLEAVRARIEAFVSRQTDMPAPAAAAEPSAQEPAPQVSRRAEAAMTIRVPMEKLSEFSDLVGEQVISRSVFEQQLNRLSQLWNELQASASRLRRSSDRLEASFETVALGSNRITSGRKVSGLTQDFDDLEMDRYTEFHLISRELSETATDLQTLTGELGLAYSEFEGSLTRQNRLGGEMEEKLTRLRMVPIGSIAEKMRRTIRNAASVAGKNAQLVLEGEQTGLDKTVLEAIAAPLTHLLRNAVDHGLETPEVRMALGKPTVGTVRIKADHIGGLIQISVQDDGRGIDVAMVRDAAVRKGLIDAAAILDDAQTLNLLFTPGFSTKAEVSELSGRGVGLDVVRTALESIKGTVSIQSTVGTGTTFTIRLPLTLAVIKALMTEVQQQRYALPLDCVEEIHRLDDVAIDRLGTQSFVRKDGERFPIVRLADALGLESSSDSGTRPPVILVRAGSHRAALVVDTLLGGKEIVVKRLGPFVNRQALVSGATLMGDGGVVLILSPDEIVRSGRVVPTVPTRRATVPSRDNRGLSVMIVDDSPSVRRVLTGLIERNGWTATTAKDGMDALEILQQGRVMPDVVLSDVEMPRMDGYELLSTLKGQASTQSIPVVVITSRAANRHRQKAMDLGASAYVVKPYQDDSLVEIVRQLARSTASAHA